MHYNYNKLCKVWNKDSRRRPVTLILDFSEKLSLCIRNLFNVKLKLNYKLELFIKNQLNFVFYISLIWEVSFNESVFNILLNQMISKEWVMNST